MQKISILIFLFVVFQNTIAQKPKLKFDYIGTEQGLKDNYVESVLQDKNGFMWFATDNGLYKYDGYDCKAYKYNYNQKKSLAYNHVYTLFEDSKGKLWIGFRVGGIALYSAETDSFINKSLTRIRLPTRLLKTVSMKYLKISIRIYGM
ncbi:MAG: hypothetical protein IPO21_15260 [Bacteroidales bacterium]|nr:hypothetical protein [Bacteroidales bacterium]